MLIEQAARDADGTHRLAVLQEVDATLALHSPATAGW